MAPNVSPEAALNAPFVLLLNERVNDVRISSDDTRLIIVHNEAILKGRLAVLPDTPSDGVHGNAGPAVGRDQTVLQMRAADLGHQF